MSGDGGGGTANNVYIRSDEYGWIPARLVEQDKLTAKVAIPQYEAEEFILSDGGKGAVGFKSAVVKLKDYNHNTLPLQNVDKSGVLKEVDDMVDLTYLHEVSISLLPVVLVVAVTCFQIEQNGGLTLRFITMISRRA